MANEPRTSKFPAAPSEPVSAEQSIIDARRAKAARLRARGENPFANDLLRFGPVIDIADVRRGVEAAHKGGKYDAASVEQVAGQRLVHVCGRVIAFRSTGALSFARIRDRTGEIQLMLDQAVLKEDYERLVDVDVGDFVDARGTLTASRRGELSVVPRELRILTKAFRPLPEKWHGLTDVELRYRQRYVDLIANPSVTEVFRARSHIVRATREILDAHGFLEVETPTMHSVIGGAAARPFATHHNALDMMLYMRIAPELYLKRLVVGGLERVYEIGRSYRNEGISTRHNPEFTMLELYWAYATYDDLMDFNEVVLRGIDAKLAEAMPAAHGRWKAERPFVLDERFVRMPMDQAVVAAAKRMAIPAWVAAADAVGCGGILEIVRSNFGEHIKDWSKSSPRAEGLDWGNFRKALSRCDTDGERLFVCYEYVVEPFLAEDYRTSDGQHSVPVFIKDYPFEVSPLARRNDARPELTDRFELFVHGRELANAFSELNDPDDQAARFRAQVEKKARGEEEAMDYDEDYIRALEHGMPPAAGFGMGIDRLVMALTNSASIRDVILFPLLRSETASGGKRA
jgi:lysyl-tRNA synthetase class 2